ncbi:putative aaa family atpase protein [Phaeoacremonium minimum UCRPA7]|uniref:Putative aaa family atpase protein n=1 Tax=Phaeoacremonium minimum (strain UCR-PA7) TaxID=1286976 RepID=R8BLM3_PHAM7|nr:putative aaa family atpase protein [Phaeoacremonium minimum UCRPA7]EOO00263.1 putative aaa family atpase protein [Phaeoacremonium minimum UCRPA7]
MHIPTVQQLAAQRSAVQDGELMAWSLASEREKSLQESNNKLKARVAQLWDMNRKMIPVAPGQTFPGPPAILMAENEKSLFSDGSSGPLVQPVQCNQSAAPETEKEMSQDEDFIPDILLPGPGLPYQAACRGKTYADIPLSRDDHAAGSHHIAGDTLISDFKAYVALNRDVRFYVFRDYECPKQASRDWTKPDESTSNEIHVVSDELKRTLTSISRCLPDGDTQSRSNTNGFNRPLPPDGVYRPRFLYHHREILQNILANEPFRADIKALLWFLGHESPDYGRLKTCDFLFKQGKVCANTLPWLFCPNSMVIATKRGPDSNIPAAYVLEDWPIEIDGGLQLNCWSWGYDGQRLQRRQICLTVKVARDAIVDITSLSVYPAKNMVDEVRQRLVSRGQQFWGYRHQQHVSYQGWDYQKERKYGQGSRCMIDYQTYRKFHGAATAFSFSRSAKALYDRWPESISNNSYLSEDNFMLLPPEIHGFFLKDKRWVCLCLDQITPVAWNKLAFERLVLPQKTKTLVQAMVMPRANKDADAEPEVRGDLIAGKGNGLIMLLHGPPGTGKTLTAESVAELAELPLYSVTCGDIGTSPEAVERYLNTVLHLGKTWNCVLLLDEADVFLEQRSMADLDRNSLVSVFLRTLEYYSGILILTSNRVSIFDEAFKSRIQVALSYPRLDKASRKRVWANFINMIHEDGGRGPTEAGAKFCVDYPGIVSHMDDLADCELNGRQIRNAMATARQLAGYLGETLNWGHLETAITTASDFTISQSAP